MQVIDKNLFTQVSAEESAVASGGGLLTAAAYYTVASGFGITGDSLKNTTLLFLINATQVPGLDSL